jgi:hypothetical protein
MFVFSVGCLVSRQCHMISPIVESNDSFVLVSSTLTRSPSAFMPLTRLKSLQGGAATPLAYKILCVRFTSVVHDGSSLPTKASLSVRGATLDTGGWLALTRPGLSPGKKRQASLGALTTKLSRAGRSAWTKPDRLTGVGWSTLLDEAAIAEKKQHYCA